MNVLVSRPTKKKGWQQYTKNKEETESIIVVVEVVAVVVTAVVVTAVVVNFKKYGVIIFLTDFQTCA